MGTHLPMPHNRRTAHTWHVTAFPLHLWVGVQVYETPVDSTQYQFSS